MSVRLSGRPFHHDVLYSSTDSSYIMAVPDDGLVQELKHVAPLGL